MPFIFSVRRAAVADARPDSEKAADVKLSLQQKVRQPDLIAPSPLVQPTLIAGEFTRIDAARYGMPICCHPAVFWIRQGKCRVFKNNLDMCACG